ncbi:hypothetical protein A3Q56_05001 [Intoshia linei]|uniref:Uncharacterized protein n=1 Tax=Intoshia linei TaxID=1819745 RepID=A0A177B0K7_9BILA|nr:hypothetical protein A3Q56_05001 [Intoshia linei]
MIACISIDGSKSTLKLVLLDSEINHKTLILAYSVNCVENYSNIKLMLDLIHYEAFNWPFVCNLKVVCILASIQAGNVKLPCFMCKFKGTVRENHYEYKEWPSRDSSQQLICTLHNKSLNSKTPNPQLKTIFGNKLSDQIIINGVFTGPEIDKILKNSMFHLSLTENFKRNFQAFSDVVRGFFNMERKKNYLELIGVIRFLQSS